MLRTGSHFKGAARTPTAGDSGWIVTDEELRMARERNVAREAKSQWDDADRESAIEDLTQVLDEIERRSLHLHDVVNELTSCRKDVLRLARIPSDSSPQ